MPKYPCGVCNKRATYSAIWCNGTCEKWYHFKCLNWPSRIPENISSEAWKCSSCSNENSKESSIPVDFQLLETKIQDLTSTECFDHETSLVLAAEAGTALLKQNEHLLQEIYNIKSNRPIYINQLEEKLKEAEGVIQTLTNKIYFLENQLKDNESFVRSKVESENTRQDEIIKQLEFEISKLLVETRELNLHKDLAVEQAKVLKNDFSEHRYMAEDQIDMYSKELNELKSKLNTFDTKTKTTEKIIRNIKLQNDLTASKLTEKEVSVTNCLTDLFFMYRSHIKAVNDGIETVSSPSSMEQENLESPRKKIKVKDNTNTNKGHCKNQLREAQTTPNQVRAVNTENILELLGNNWINDDIIRIHFDLINDKILKNTTIKCMNPTICQAVKVLDDTNGLLGPLKLQQYEYLVIPVNNSSGANDSDGSHWSLLICKTLNKTFYYYDSLRDHNLLHAQTIANKIFAHLCVSNNEPKPVIKICNSPQQTNSYDCGIFVLATAEMIIQQLNEAPSTSLDKVYLPQLNEIDLIAKRSLIAFVINNRTLLNTEAVASLLFYKPIFENNLQKNTYDKQTEPQSIPTTDNNIGQWFKVSHKNKKANRNNSYHLKKNTSTVVPAEEKNISNARIPTGNKFAMLGKPTDTDYRDASEVLQGNVSVSNSISHKKKEKKSNIGLSARSNRKPPKKNIKIPLVNITLCSDSQGSSVPFKISEISNGKINTFGYVRANTTLTQVVDSAHIENENPVVLLGGSNDSLKNDFTDIYENLEYKLSTISNNRQVFICTIPARYDIPSHDLQNKNIKMANNYIAELTKRLKNVTLINLNRFQKIHFTNHGLHLNGSGKKKLAYAIIDAITLWHAKRPHDISQDVLTISPTNNSSIQNVMVTEDNLKEVMNNLKDSPNVAFANTISRDFTDPKHMSAGVAVVFRTLFGRPTSADLVSNNLTCQRAEQGASVYGLVTKPRYYLKPRIPTYDEAFRQLTIDFKKKKLRKLICPPMGCVRDNIHIEQFTRNLMEFQNKTGASVHVIVFDDSKSNGLLQNGQNYQTFSRQLRSIISRAASASKTSSLEPVPKMSDMNAFPPLTPPRTTEITDQGEAKISEDGIEAEEEASSPAIQSLNSVVTTSQIKS